MIVEFKITLHGNKFLKKFKKVFDIQIGNCYYN